MIEKTPESAMNTHPLNSVGGQPLNAPPIKLGKTAAPVKILPSLVFEMPSQTSDGSLTSADQAVERKQGQ